MNAAWARQAGYTLIELLVAMLLLSFVSLAIAGGLQFGTRAWEASESTIATTGQVDETQRLLRELLTSATPHRSGGFANFDGDRRHIAFDGPAPQAAGVGGLVHFELSIDPSAGGERLALRVAAPSAGRLPRMAVLNERAGGIRFAYLDASGTIPVWLAVWRNRDRLPDAVRIASDTGDNSWPPLIVHPAIAQDADCRFDTVTASCRTG